MQGVGAVPEWLWAEDTIPEMSADTAVWCAGLPSIICCSYTEDKASAQPQFFLQCRGLKPQSHAYEASALPLSCTPVLFLLIFA